MHERALQNDGRLALRRQHQARDILDELLASRGGSWTQFLTDGTVGCVCRWIEGTFKGGICTRGRAWLVGLGRTYGYRLFDVERAYETGCLVLCKPP